MFRSKKIVLILVAGIISSLIVIYITDTLSQSFQRNRSDNQRVYKQRRYPINPSGSPLSGPWKHTSNLPLVIINTFGRWIPDEPKIPAQLKIIYDESGGRNSLDSSHIHFDGKIGIEERGQTSRMFPKKQYGFEFQDETGNDKDVPILQMPKGSDWVLNGPYTDKSLMRNHLAYEFSNRIGRYACRTRFVEVFLNTNRDREIQAKHYVGVYLLIEKIKRGTERVPIQSLQTTHTTPPDISGGYILKIDKIDRRDSGKTLFYTQHRTRLHHVYPKELEITNGQRLWIQAYMNKFENALAGAQFKDPIEGYAMYIDIDSFIDHFIINELFKNTDGFRNSTYMYKDRGGKLTMGPVWDFNLSIGNSVFHDAWQTYNWLIYTNPVPFWWHRLLSDNNFKQKLVKRWKTLRKNELTNTAILGEIDRTAEFLSEAQKRNYQRWPVLGHVLFGNPHAGKPTYHGQLDEMKTWLKTRLQWIDQNIEKLPGTSQFRERTRYRNRY